MKMTKRLSCALLVLLLSISLAACGGKAPNTATCSYDEMVSYLTGRGYIAKGTTPVDINVTAGYVTDNTGGDMPLATVADRAEDYGGLWLLWWDTANPSEAIEFHDNLDFFDGIIVVAGGACILETSAHSGAFAIAFAEDYAKRDAVLADFNALQNE